MRRGKPTRHPYLLEPLERRELLSAAALATISTLESTSTTLQPAVVLHPTYQLDTSFGPLQTAGPQGYTPAEIRNAYGLNQINGNGAGQTIAIIDAYNDPKIAFDLHAFDVAFGLPDPTLQVVAQDGSANLPGVDPVGPGGANFEGEEALDVEWAHALAPGATIMLVESRDASPTNIFAAVNFARQHAGVSVVSMSFGGSESSSETQYDNIFATPANHIGVTFIASAGDSGTPASYPAYSPNVVAAGGTSLSLNSLGNYQSEIAWSGSGGGISTVEAQPSYQNGIVTQSSTFRANPDVAFDADPRTGVAVYDSYNNGTAAPWEVLGGTSVSAPTWSGILAVANQGRVAAGKDTLDSRTGTLPLLYSAPASDFHDITSGSNGISAKTGYDLVTGRGSPLANLLIPYLINGAITLPPPQSSGPTIASLSVSSTSVTEGTTVTLTANGVSDPGGTGLAVTFYEETNGTAGLQTTSDFAFSPVTDGSNTIQLDTSGVTGTFTIYAQLTDASGAASPAGTSAPSITITVLAPNTSGPTIGSISATPNPVPTGKLLTLSVGGLADPLTTVRRVTYYEETNNIPGLQTGAGGDFAFRSATVASNFSMQLDTTGSIGDFTIYAQATDSLGNVSAKGPLAPAVNVIVTTGPVAAAPQHLLAFAVSPTSVDLVFTESDSTVTGFSIERAQDPAFTTFTRVFSIDRSDTLNYIDSGLAPNTRYYYRVQAVNSTGNSAFSNTASAATPVNFASPIGGIDVASRTAVAGWAIDRDSPSEPITVDLYIDGALFSSQSASINRPDVGAIFGFAGHGYSFDISALAPGFHRLEVYAHDSTTGLPWRIAPPKTINTNRPPLGSIDLFDGTLLAGWTLDPDTLATSIQILYAIDNNAPVLATASLARSDIGTAFGSANHGYSIALPQLTAGSHSIKVYAVDSTTDALTLLGTRNAIITGPAGDPLPLGHLDLANTTMVAGWALDPSSPDSSINVRVDIDGVAGTPFAASLARPDVANAMHHPGNFGFSLPLSLAPGEHRIDVYAIDTTTAIPVLLASRNVTRPAPAAPLWSPAGNIDQLSTTQISGWAWSIALAGASALIRIDIDGHPGAALAANLPRPDISAVFGNGDFGFSATMPGLAPGNHSVSLVILDSLTLTPTVLITRPLTIT